MRKVLLLVTLNLAMIFGAGSIFADTVILQQGLDGYIGARDVWLYDSAATGNLGANTYMVTRNDASGKSTSLIAFDLSGIIPGGSTVTSATLKIYNYGARYNETTSIGIYRLLRYWVEGNGTISAIDYTNGATYNYYEQQPTDLPWEVAGGLGTTDSVSTATDTTIYAGSTSGVGWISFDVASDVTNFVAGSLNNYGWVLSNSAGKSDQRFYTSDYTDDISLRPVLEIEYNVPEPISISILTFAGIGLFCRHKKTNRF